jgi:hypothetical protein
VVVGVHLSSYCARQMVVRARSGVHSALAGSGSANKFDWPDAQPSPAAIRREADTSADIISATDETVDDPAVEPPASRAAEFLGDRWFALVRQSLAFAYFTLYCFGRPLTAGW